MTATSTASGSKHPIKIVANIFISFIGAGVLGLPFAFKEAGVLEGTVIMAAVGCISVKAMLLIIDCKYRLIQKSQPNGSAKSAVPLEIRIKEMGAQTEEHDILIDAEANGVHVRKDEHIPPAPGQDLTYGDVGYYAIGHTGRLLVEISIVVSQVGFCCAYLIFISENMSSYIHGLSIYHWLLILLPPLAILTLLRHLSSLAWTSLFAQGSNLLAFTVVLWFDFEHFSQVELHPKEFSLEGFPFFLAIAIYCYEGAGMILSLESSLHDTVRHKFRTYFNSTLGVVTIMYISFGVCGYLSFGPHTNEIITLNLPRGQGLDAAIMVKSCLCLALFCTYPLMMFPVITILEKKLIPNPGEKIWQGNILRICMVSITGLVVLAIPNFANLMALVGATCCTLIAFILPGLFHMKIFKGATTKCGLCFDIFLIFLGIVGAIIGTLDALQRLRETHTIGEVDMEVTPTLSHNISSITSNLTSTISHIQSISKAALNTTLSSTAVSAVSSLATPMLNVTKH